MFTVIVTTSAFPCLWNMCSIGRCELAFYYGNEKCIGVKPTEASQTRQALWVSHSMAAENLLLFLEGCVNKGQLCVYQDFCGLCLFLGLILTHQTKLAWTMVSAGHKKVFKRPFHKLRPKKVLNQSRESYIYKVVELNVADRAKNKSLPLCFCLVFYKYLSIHKS